MEQDTTKVWDKILNIRSCKRFNSRDIMKYVFESFFELHGDRYFYDDPAIIGGLAYLKEIPVTVIAQCRGRTSIENQKLNYGMAMPEGYRKALRLMKQAEKFKRPIISLIDTPGAFPGIEAEERGQAEAIAKNLYEMSMIKVPIISIIVGEGGSGGALALAVANKLIMLENAVFSVVSPEGCASILWRDSNKAPEAADRLKISAQDLLQLGIVDMVIEEEENLQKMSQGIIKTLYASLKEYEQYSGIELSEMRYKKYRRIGNRV